jgi:hypothetical protein
MLYPTQAYPVSYLLSDLRDEKENRAHTMYSHETHSVSYVISPSSLAVNLTCI